jgi:hypothetical protein
MKDERDHRISVPTIVDGVIPIALTLLGLLHPKSPSRWFGSLALSFAVLAGPVLAGSAIVTLLARRFGARIQGPRVKPALIAREAFESAGHVRGRLLHGLAAHPVEAR